MAGTAKEWNMYQVSKALLRREQQNVLSEIEWHMARSGPGLTLGGIDVFNDDVNTWRGGEYTPAENKRFLNELAEVSLCCNDRSTFQKPFDSVKFYRTHGEKRFSIVLSDYFSKVIGTYIRDNWGEQYDQH